MEYTIGQRLMWHRLNSYDEPEEVVVDSLRKRGAAKLSNGWLVDSDGVAEGNSRIQGGFVKPFDDAKQEQ